MQGEHDGDRYALARILPAAFRQRPRGGAATVGAIARPCADCGAPADQPRKPCPGRGPPNCRRSPPTVTISASSWASSTATTAGGSTPGAVGYAADSPSGHHGVSIRPPARLACDRKREYRYSLPDRFEDEFRANVHVQSWTGRSCRTAWPGLSRMSPALSRSDVLAVDSPANLQQTNVLATGPELKLGTDGPWRGSCAGALPPARPKKPKISIPTAPACLRGRFGRWGRVANSSWKPRRPTSACATHASSTPSIDAAMCWRVFPPRARAPAST